jgi:hypothetical protein
VAETQSLNTTKPCGSGLARDGDIKLSINVECDGLIAGKPAPTGSALLFKIVFENDLHLY